MLKIRLQRTGKRGQAYFRLVVVEHTVKTGGEYLELLGSYDPHKNEVKAKGERIKYWVSKGAQLSATVNNLLVGNGVIEGEKVQAWKPKRKSKDEVEGKKEKNTESQTEKPIAEENSSPEKITETQPEPIPESPVEAPVS